MPASLEATLPIKGFRKAIYT